jgi:hypothetical protein
MSKLTTEQMAILASNDIYSLRSAGYSVSALLSAGYSASDLRSAGYSASALLSAGYSVSDLCSAGYSVSALRSAGYSASDVPILINPYSKMWADIQAKTMNHDQSTFGPTELQPEANICGSAMCTAGALVQMGGEKGWALQEKFGFATAAWLIHDASHPSWPCQNFGTIPQEWALAYIEKMAERELEEANA